MSSDETRKSKSEKSSTPPPDQSNVHAYPDWAAMQAYYGPRGCMPPPPYFSPAVAPVHPPPSPYMWGPPQPMMPPYGQSYPFYAHGGVYPHPGMPLAPPPPNVETPAKADAPTKSSGNTEQGLMKNLKGFDGLAMSIGTGNAESGEDGSKSANSQSTETEGSSNGSYENTTEEDQKGRKRNREDKQATGGNRRQTKNGSGAVVEVNGAAGKASANLSGFAGTETALELKNPPTAVVKTSPADSPQSWLQTEKELKREKRKQSNRESARRSRLRKQAETEELAKKVEALLTDNSNLRYELILLSEKSEKLKIENATLMKNLKIARGGQSEQQLVQARVGDKRAPITTENLLSRVDNPGPAGRGGEMYENKSSKSGGKLRQLLHPNPRADAVVAR